MKTKSKKFTQRQKIILIVAISLLLVLIITPIVLIIREKNKTKSIASSTSNQKGPNKPNTQKLVEERNKILTILEKEIKDKNVKTDNLLSELKTKHNLPASETN